MRTEERGKIRLSGRTSAGAAHRRAECYCPCCLLLLLLFCAALLRSRSQSQRDDTPSFLKRRGGSHPDQPGQSPALSKEQANTDKGHWHANGHDHASVVVVEGVRFSESAAQAAERKREALQENGRPRGGRKRTHRNHDGRWPNKGGTAGGRRQLQRGRSTNRRRPLVLLSRGNSKPSSVTTPTCALH